MLNLFAEQVKLKDISRTNDLLLLLICWCSSNMDKYLVARRNLETELRAGKVRGQRAKELSKDILNSSVPLTTRYQKIDVTIIRKNSFERDGPGIPHLAKSLVILEVYGKNLLKSERPKQWRIIRKSNPKFSSEVAPVIGHLEILKQLGYTKDVADGLAFPDNVLVPDVPVVASITADIVLLRQELILLFKDRHPRVNDFLDYLSRNEIRDAQVIMRQPIEPRNTEQNLSVTTQAARHMQETLPPSRTSDPLLNLPYNRPTLTIDNKFSSLAPSSAFHGLDEPETRSMPYHQTSKPMPINESTLNGSTTVPMSSTTLPVAVKPKIKTPSPPQLTSDEDILDEPGSCDVCGENEARYECLKCIISMQKLCKECDARVHTHPKRRGHERALLKFDIPRQNQSQSSVTNPLHIRPKESPSFSSSSENNYLEQTQSSQVTKHKSPFSPTLQVQLYPNNRPSTSSSGYNTATISNSSEFVPSTSASTSHAPKSLTAGDWDQKVAELIDVTNSERRKQKSENLLEEINQKISNYHKIMEEIRIKNPHAHSLVNHMNEKIEELKMTKGVVETLCQENNGEAWNDDKYEVESFDTTPAVINSEKKAEEEQPMSNLSNIQPEEDQVISHPGPSNISNGGSEGSSINARKRKHESNNLISLDQEVESASVIIPNVTLIDVEKPFLPNDDNDEVTTTKALNLTNNQSKPDMPSLLDFSSEDIGFNNQNKFEMQSLLDIPIEDPGLAKPAFNSYEDPFSTGDMLDFGFSSLSYEPADLKELMEKETRLYESMKMVEYLRSGKNFSPEQIEMANKILVKEGIFDETPVGWLEKNWEECVSNVQQFTEFAHVSVSHVSQVLLSNHCDMSNTVADLDKEVEEIASTYTGYSAKEVIAAVKESQPGNTSEALAKLTNDTTKLLLEDLEKDKAMTFQEVFILSVHRNHALYMIMAIYRRMSISVVYYEETLKAFWLGHYQELNNAISDRDIIETVRNTENAEEALSQLDKECMICYEHMPYTKINCMPTCGDNGCAYCSECLFEHLTVCIRDKNIRDITCPNCGFPDIDIDDETATNHFNFLDHTLRNNIELHNLFQQKLRDFTLRRMPNFRWCSHCTAGFQFEPENEDNFKMICPYCNKGTCYKCKKQWEVQHEGISCEQFQEWKENNDPQYQTMGLAAHLKENGIDCPDCHFRYALAKGGCMHFRCSQCSHEFCSGCNSAFKQGRACTKSNTCAKLGLHAHHPRDCLSYLRDCSAEDLQKLLRKYKIEFNIKNGDEVKCQVMEQKELSTGLKDDVCGRDVVANQGGLCDLHYKEYLVSLVNKKQLDPAEIFDINTLQTCLLREGIEIPKQKRMDDKQYKAILLKEVKKFPLIHQRTS